MTQPLAAYSTVASAWRIVQVCLCGLWVVQCLASTGFAGCHYTTDEDQQVQVFDGSQAGRLPRWSWWAGGKVKRIYEGGRFDYYQLPGGQIPCKGPACDGVPSKTTLTVVPSMSTQRISGEIEHSAPRVLSTPPSSKLFGISGIAHESPILCGLLRPPKAS